ncbi:MAG: hypothetical protein QOI66_4198 [Myxococcales bacterium]|jgi:hypothetical protein|nr:hypothetical protein [Myxococcales bacterium]
MHLHPPHNALRVLGLAVVFLVGGWGARAFASPPFVGSGDDERLLSRNGKFYALPLPKKAITPVYRVGKPRDTEIYRLPGSQPTTFVSDDGDYAVVGNIGNNVLPADVRPDEPMLLFYYRARLIKTVVLQDLIADIPAARRSSPRWTWGWYWGFFGAREFMVGTVEGRRLTYDVSTGVITKSEFVKEQVWPSRR